MRVREFLAVLFVVAIVALALPGEAGAGPYCPTRDELITIIAHKADVERGGRSASKWRIWQIAERESGLNHCWPNGTVKVSVTNDRGGLQLNPGGVFLNCAVNPYCNRPDMIDDVFLQVDIMLNYFDRYGDLCPWNPTGNYMPGCGYY